MSHTEKEETMRGLTIMYTDLALESLCGDLAWEVLKLVQGAGDGCGDTVYAFGDRSCSRAIGGEVLVLECRALGGPDCLEVTARLVGETDPRYHGSGSSGGCFGPCSPSVPATRWGCCGSTIRGTGTGR